MSWSLLRRLVVRTTPAGRLPWAPVTSRIVAAVMQARGLPVPAAAVPASRNPAHGPRTCLAVIPRSRATWDDGTPFSRCLTRYFRIPQQVFLSWPSVIGTA